MKAEELVMRRMFAILSAVLGLAAVALTFVPHFITASLDIEATSVSASTHAWHEFGVLGGLLAVVMFVIAIVVLILEFAEPRIGRWFAWVAAVSGALSLAFLVVFELTGGPDADTIGGDLEFRVGPGWAGWLCMSALAIAIAIEVALTAFRVPPATPPYVQNMPWPPQHGYVAGAWPPPPPPSHP